MLHNGHELCIRIKTKEIFSYFRGHIELLAVVASFFSLHSSEDIFIDEVRTSHLSDSELF